MPLKRRKQAKQPWMRWAATLVFSFALVSPVHRLAMLATTRDESTFVPHHSLEQQLLKRGGDSTAPSSVREESVARHHNGRGAIIKLNGASSSKLIHDDDHGSDESERRNHEDRKDDAAKTATFIGKNDKAVNETKTDDESIRGADISPPSSKKRIRNVATRNSSLPIHSSPSNERLSEIKSVADVLRYTNNNNNTADDHAALTRESQLANATLRREHHDANQQQPKLRGSNTSLLQQESNTSIQTQQQQQQPTRHVPNYFTNEVPLERLLKRMNLVTPYTGCSIAAFQYNLGKHAHPEFNDCFVHCGKNFAKARGIRFDNARELVQEHDTIFVQFNKLDHFVNKTMQEIDVNYVILSGNEQKVDPISKETFDAVVNNPHVIHWFMQNMDVYSHDLNHHKISPWPYGTNPKKMAFLADELLKQEPEKNTTIYKSGFSRATNPQRRTIPYGPRVPITQYLQEMRASKYILSPDGDRPECYRHYEAIGMGSMPITQMNAKSHTHLGDNIIYNNTNWNLTSLEETLPKNPRVNRRLVFEEYWMEYVERIVGRPLRWYDPSRDVHSSLAGIQHLVANDTFVPRDEVCVVANGTPFVGHRGPLQDFYAILKQEQKM